MKSSQLIIFCVLISISLINAECPFAKMLGLKASGKNPHVHTETQNPELIQLKKRILQQSNGNYLSALFQCGGKAAKTTTQFTSDDYDKVAQDVLRVFDSLDKTCENNNCPRADFAGCIVRLAGHDFMDFRRQTTNTGGSDGCINMEEADNKGLDDCIMNVQNPEQSLQASYKNFCEQVSLADFIVISAEALMGKLATNPQLTSQRFKDSFMWGRTTQDKCDWNKDRMPNPEDGCPGLKNIFIDHIYNAHQEKIPSDQRNGYEDTPLSWILTAAISGAHTLGKAQLKNSGYQGWWSDAQSSMKFNNDYYDSLVFKGWGPLRSVDGNDNKNQWVRMDQGFDLRHVQFMLDTDMCLAFKRSDKYQTCFKDFCKKSKEQNGKCDTDKAKKLCENLKNTGTELSASKGRPCCAWVQNCEPFVDLKLGRSIPDYCGVKNVNRTGVVNQRQCCVLNEMTGVTENWECDENNQPRGVAYPAIQMFLKDEENWLQMFHKAWFIATSNGYFIEGKQTLKYLKVPREINVDYTKQCAEEGRTCNKNKNCFWNKEEKKCDGRKYHRVEYPWGLEDGFVSWTTLDERSDGASCENKCQNKGSCQADGRCKCRNGWSGAWCNIHRDEQKGCQNDCNNSSTEKRGVCFRERCYCYNGFEGESCEIKK